MSEETKAKLMRVFVNGVIVVLGAAITALFQYIASLDWGAYSPAIMAISTTLIKAVQTWAEPAQEVYKL